MGVFAFKITMVHELDIGFFATTMRKAFEKLGHEVVVVQGYKTYLEEEPKIDYLMSDENGVPYEQMLKDFENTDFFILRFLSDISLRQMRVANYANSRNSIYKVHGSEMRDRNIPYQLLTWHLEWYHNEPTVCGPRDWSLKDKYQSGVITHIERPLDFDLIPKRVASPPHAISTPTNIYKKGTELLVEAWKHCPTEIPLELVYGVDRSTCLEAKSKASLYIDRLGDYEHGPYGMNSAEAWLMKIPVFSQIRSWDKVFCAELEKLITPIDQFTIVDKVKDFVENPKSYKKQIDFAYDYVRQTHNPDTIAKQYIALAEEIGKQ